jgi:hypothetical protein
VGGERNPGSRKRGEKKPLAFLAHLTSHPGLFKSLVKLTRRSIHKIELMKHGIVSVKDRARELFFPIRLVLTGALWPVCRDKVPESFRDGAIGVDEIKKAKGRHYPASVAPRE